MVITIHVESDGSLRVSYKGKNVYYDSQSILAEDIREVIEEFEVNE
jgi:hypothetical protein